MLSWMTVQWELHDNTAFKGEICSFGIIEKLLLLVGSYISLRREYMDRGSWYVVGTCLNLLTNAHSIFYVPGDRSFANVVCCFS